MKIKILTVMLLLTLMSCSQKVTLELDYGAIKPLLESGSFGSTQTKSTYCVYLIGSTYKLKQGYLIVNLIRTRQNENEAYKIFDEWNMARNARSIDVENYNWATFDAEYKSEVMEMRRNYFDYAAKVNKHVRLVVDKRSLETGIDYDSKLIYVQ